MNADDQDMPKFLKIFSLKQPDEIESMIADLATNPNAVKKILAEELTTRIHSFEAFDSAMKVSELLFNPKVNKDFLLSLTPNQLGDIAGELANFSISSNAFEEISIIDLLSGLTSICSSKSEARKAIQNQAISINKRKINSIEEKINKMELVHHQYLIVENGKKNKYLILVN